MESGATTLYLTNFGQYSNYEKYEVNALIDFVIGLVPKWERVIFDGDTKFSEASFAALFPPILLALPEV